MNRLLIIVIGVVILIASYVVLTRQVSQNQAPPTTQDNNVASSKQTQISTECTGEPTTAQTEGPYYKSGSPERKNIAENVPGEKLTVTGFVYDQNCEPVAHAWLDFWQADSEGVYDNTGYTLRGHQFTNEDGKYTLQTIVPAAYESRPPHIHVKIRVGDGEILTSQLYFPNASQNQTDSIFNDELLMQVTNEADSKTGVFNFILPSR